MFFFFFLLFKFSLCFAPKAPRAIPCMWKPNCFKPALTHILILHMISSQLVPESEAALVCLFAISVSLVLLKARCSPRCVCLFVFLCQYSLQPHARSLTTESCRAETFVRVCSLLYFSSFSCYFFNFDFFFLHTNHVFLPFSQFNVWFSVNI